MRKLFVINVFILACLLYANNPALECEFSSNKSLTMGLCLPNETISYHFGGSYKIVTPRGKEIETQLSNYGKTTDGSDTKLWTVDLGIGYKLGDLIRFAGEISLGENEKYTNYIDKRFNDGGYHMITDSKFVLGIGGNISLITNDNFEILASYNSLKSVSIGFRFFFINPTH